MTVTIVFDLDDTLYLESDYVRSGIAAVDGWAQRERGIAGFGLTARALWEAGLREKLFDATLAALGLPSDPATIAAMVLAYRDHVPNIGLTDDARAFLSSNHGYSLALISDGFARAQHRKISALQLPGYGFEPIICTDDWGRNFWKPHRRAFETVASAHRGRADRLVYVADNPAKDFLAPRALGWATVQIDRPGAIHPRLPPSADHQADTTIETLHDLTVDRVASLLERHSGKAPA